MVVRLVRQVVRLLGWGVVALGVAILVAGIVWPGKQAEPRVHAVSGDRFTLPDPPGIGGHVFIYGRPGDPDMQVDARSLGCHVGTRDGRPSRAVLTTFGARRSERAKIDGEAVRPLFGVRNYRPGSMVVCTHPEFASPLGIGQSTVFGPYAYAVKAVAVLVSLVVVALGLAVLAGAGGVRKRGQDS